jgi:hypothetical protein
MDALEATQQAAGIEFALGASAEEARVECFAVPRRKGSSRRSTRWLFLVVTNLPEREVRDGLSTFQVETIGRRGGRTTYVAWPPQA